MTTSARTSSAPNGLARLRPPREPATYARITGPRLDSPEVFFNRELSWVRFNERVLEEAENPGHPLLERLKFLAIFSANLDEFFMIRVAGLKEQINANIYHRTPDGRTPKQQIQEITTLVRTLVDRHSRCFLKDLRPALAADGIHFINYAATTDAERDELKDYFNRQVFPLLTPMAIDPAHPFPKVRGLELNLLVELKPPFEEGPRQVAVLPVPKLLSRFIPLQRTGQDSFLPVEELIQAHLGAIFPNMTVLNVDLFRVTRNADLDIAEDEADDLLKQIERELRKRRLGTIIRLEVSAAMPEISREYLRRAFRLHKKDLFEVKAFLSAHQFMQLLDEVDRPDLRNRPFTPAPHPQVVASPDIFSAIRKGDFMVFHPYDSFQPVVEFLRTAARDPDVVAIKQTLYRTGGNSSIVQALKEAANKGKQVLALIELKARFDEENNITWARELEDAGVNVVYGLVGLKTHCKASLVARREGDDVRQYAHLSTGNYNEKTATLYTDLGLFSCRPSLMKDLSELFNLLTGYSAQEEWREILVAPVNMREQLKRQIQLSIHHHRPEQPSRIQMVMNSLVDPDMIRALYRASMAGVRTELHVRGICCLRPGLPGISENIRVTSIVGRFLEHSRLYAFDYDGQHVMYCGSADLMPRNLNRRIEVLFPVHAAELRQKLQRVLDAMSRDNVQLRELQPDGTYHHVRPNDAEDAGFSAQRFFLQEAEQRLSAIDTIPTKQSLD